MFSLLTLQPTHSINSFGELAERIDIVPIVDQNFNEVSDIPILNQINQSRLLKKFKNVDLAHLIKPDHVFLADCTNMLFSK